MHLTAHSGSVCFKHMYDRLPVDVGSFYLEVLRRLTFKGPFKASLKKKRTFN